MGGPLRVIVVAEHASHVYGGEAALPLAYFCGLRARGVDAWLTVHERTRAELVELLGADIERVVFIADTRMNVLLYRLSGKVPRRVGEAVFGQWNVLLTQRAQKRRLPALLTVNTVVHQPIPVSPKAPSLLYGVGAPVLIGPMNGGMDYPPAFRTEESWAVRTALAAGRAVSGLVNRMLPGKRDAAVLLVANERTRDALPLQPKGRVVTVAENGVDLRTWTHGTGAGANSGANAGGRFLYMGRLVDWKALDVVLRALRSVPGATLQVAGSGAMLAAWTELVRTLGVLDRVDFLGWQAPAECAALLRDCTALVLPSVLEAGGQVVLQAMSAGRPVIATRWGGPADYLDATCGVLVEPESREALERGFAEGMQRLMASPETCRRMGENGRRRVEEVYDWEKKIDLMLELYDEALGMRVGQATPVGRDMQVTHD